MIGALLLAVQIAAQAPAQTAPAAEVTARLAAMPEHAQIGEPVTLVLTVERPSALTVEPPAIEPGVQGAWMFVEPLASRRGVPADRPGFVVDTSSWRAFALEGGAALPTLEVKWSEIGVEHSAASVPAIVAVAPSLAQGEDAPRPAKGFREPIEWSGGGSRLKTAAFVLLALLVAALGAWIVRRRRRRAAPPATFSALTELAAIEARPRDEAAAARAGLYDLTRLVRRAIDAHVKEQRAASTDEEWLRWVGGEPRVPEGVRSGVRRLLERAERIKYAGETPTRFAVDEALADARAILDALEPDPPEERGVIALLLQAGDEPVKSAAEEGWKLFGAYSLSDPWFLLLVPTGIALMVWGRTGRVRARVPQLPGGAMPRSLRQRLTWLVPVLQVVSLSLVAIALARPLRGSMESATESEGVDIALVIDRSDSMRAEDLEANTTRLDVVKSVVRDFATRRMTDREGASDSIALVVFAMYPQLLCPFTLDVDAITGFIDGVQVAQNPAENGTAIGSGLAKAVQLLRQTESRSKVAVLLTDGENNVFHVPPLEAADFAAREKVRVYAIFAGRYAYRPDFLGRPGYSEREIDTSDMRAIADRTGGRFFRARDRAELESAYAEIEKLERTKRVTRRWSETFDLYPWFLAPGIAAYVLCWLIGSTWLRRLA